MSIADIANLRKLADEWDERDPMIAYALQGCADEIEHLRAIVKQEPPAEREGWILVPREPTLEMLEAGNEAARAVRSTGISGMTIEAQIRSQCVREHAAYAAMIAAAPRDGDA